MDEPYWNRLTDPEFMIEWMPSRVTRGQMMLFAAACARQIEGEFHSPLTGMMIDRAEEYGSAPSKPFELVLQLAQLTQECYRTIAMDVPDASDRVVLQLILAGFGGPPLASEKRFPRRGRLTLRNALRGMEIHGYRREALEPILLRDILGPYQPIAFEHGWRSSTVATLAAAIRAERAFEQLPILADALQDAGCENPRILAHCREPQMHVKGCWVIEGLHHME